MNYLFISITVAVLIGIVLGRFAFPYRPAPKADGVIEVTEGAKMIFQLEITSEPESLAEKAQVIFDIVKKPGVS